MIMAAPAVASVYDQLVAICLPLLSHHHDDLLVHDRESIERDPSCPFLHYARDMGTTIIMMPDAGTYPRRNERIKYLFGTADRWQILRDVAGMAEYHTRPNNNPEQYTVHHWDGKQLRKITADKAVEIAKQYQRSIEHQWRQHNLACKLPEYS